MRDMWADVFLAGHFDMDILDGYFNEWKDRFFLFGDRPFFQVPELEYVGQKEYDPVSEMIADMPSPKNICLRCVVWGLRTRFLCRRLHGAGVFAVV